ncbi:MAG TPA: polyphosphate kinase 1 [Firmicutes bacterium]|jgi:polyphosphate kinase|nr:polyphosphate kinase 1 [Bacillota bacterium]
MAVSTKTQLNAATPERSVETTAALSPSSLYFNREFSWLQFNKRVLQEAQDETNPLLERVKFLAIFANNLDEFFMIRVAGLQKQLEAGALKVSVDGMEPCEQLAMIRHELLPLLTAHANCWQRDILPKLKSAGIRILNYCELTNRQRQRLQKYFAQEIFPTLTPLAIDPGHPFPHISNLSLNLAVIIDHPEQGEKFARLKIPDMIPRLIRIPGDGKMSGQNRQNLINTRTVTYVLIEEVVAANLDLLFQSLPIKASYPFRITRDADLEIEEDEASDLLSCIQESVGMRRFGFAVRLEVDKTMPKPLRVLLMKNLHLEPYQIYAVNRPIGMANFLELTKIERSDLKDRPFRPALPTPPMPGEDIFAAIRRSPLLLYHPYDSFSPVVDFVLKAARDPNVLTIKQTLYRVGVNSPIVQALMEARENGKQVAVLVELKARFDEENNIGWAQALERAGVHVVYGLLGLKTHAKICLVVRREGETINRYVHMSTGNYNVVTSRIYTDLSYFSCDLLMGADVSDLFNALTGYSRKDNYDKIWVAPGSIRQRMISLIEREISQHQAHADGYLAFKMNSLVDQDCIAALYRASQAGVTIDLQVRGICCLRPGIPGLSENISVTSIVGRFLEHTRIYYFHNGGQSDVLLGSADLMPRNLDRRIEILFPIEDSRLKNLLINQVLQIHLRDNIKAQTLFPDGHYQKNAPAQEELRVHSQDWMLEHPGLFFAHESVRDKTTCQMVAAVQEESPLPLAFKEEQKND